jgi:hypothetical protein
MLSYRSSFRKAESSWIAEDNRIQAYSDDCR